MVCKKLRTWLEPTVYLGCSGLSSEILGASAQEVAHFQKAPEFRAKYPEITLSMSAQPQLVSLSRRKADVALRLTRPEEPNNVVRKIGHIPYALYASPSYTFFDPDRWAFIAYDAQFLDLPQQQWLIQIAGERRIGCELSDVSSQLVAACSGAGIAGLPRFLGDAQPGLKRIEYDGAPPFQETFG